MAEGPYHMMVRREAARAAAFPQNSCGLALALRRAKCPLVDSIHVSACELSRRSEAVERIRMRP
jgi:hypothetical protein